VKSRTCIIVVVASSSRMIRIIGMRQNEKAPTSPRQATCSTRRDFQIFFLFQKLRTVHHGRWTLLYYPLLCGCTSKCQVEKTFWGIFVFQHQTNIKACRLELMMSPIVPVRGSCLLLGNDAWHLLCRYVALRCTSLCDARQVPNGVATARSWMRPSDIREATHAPKRTSSYWCA